LADGTVKSSQHDRNVCNRKFRIENFFSYFLFVRNKSLRKMQFY
jgi:hypothetical protein